MNDPSQPQNNPLPPKRKSSNDVDSPGTSSTSPKRQKTEDDLSHQLNKGNDSKGNTSGSYNEKDSKYKTGSTDEESNSSGSNKEGGLLLIPDDISHPNAVLDLVAATLDGIEHEPEEAETGESGAYKMYNGAKSEFVAVFKPMDKEAESGFVPGAGIRIGTIAGKGFLREAAVYQLDHPTGGARGISRVDTIGFSGVPPTCVVEIFGPSSVVKVSGIGSLQKYMPNEGSCQLEHETVNTFPIAEVHKIAVLDLRFANADRHFGNILWAKTPEGPRLIPIDHGYCWPSTFADCRFDWMNWPQAEKPFSQETLAYIESLSADYDINLLSKYGWKMPLENQCIFRTATLVLKRQAKKGSTPFKIGTLMSRHGNANAKSMMEHIFDELSDALPREPTEEDFMKGYGDGDGDGDGYGYRETATP